MYNNAYNIYHPVAKAIIFMGIITINVLLVFAYAYSTSVYNQSNVLSSYSTTPEGIITGRFKEGILQETNKAREEYGLPPLAESNKLNAVAMYKARHMKQNNYWDHIYTDGTSVGTFAEQIGYRYIMLGENLAENQRDAEEAINSWMESETHRNNLLSKDFTEIGVYVMNWDYQGVPTKTVVQVFGKPTILEQLH